MLAAKLAQIEDTRQHPGEMCEFPRAKLEDLGADQRPGT